MAAAKPGVLGFRNRSLLHRGWPCYLDWHEGPLAAILLTVMIASFGVLANGRMLVANHSSDWNWT